jgi:hypothetical protein
VKYFRHTLEAVHYRIMEDHKSLNFSLKDTREYFSSCQFNYLEIIFQLAIDIRRISGQDNVFRDTPSRVEVITSPVMHDAFAAAQEDNEIQSLLVSNID